MRLKTIHPMPRKLLRWAIFPLVLLISSCATTGIVNPPPPVAPLTDYYFDKITFEIAPIASAMPTTAALERFRSKLHSNKLCRRDQVTFLVRPPVQMIGFPGFWVGFSIQEYERQRRTLIDLDPQDRNLVVFVSYVDGFWAEGGTVRFLGGLQYGETSFAVFMAGASGRESSVLLHEFGHMLGLVKSKQHPNPDADHKYHCANEKCAMYWSAPGVNADFDDDCRQELARLMAARTNE